MPASFLREKTEKNNSVSKKCKQTKRGKEIWQPAAALAGSDFFGIEAGETRRLHAVWALLCGGYIQL